MTLLARFRIGVLVQVPGILSGPGQLLQAVSLLLRSRHQFFSLYRHLKYGRRHFWRRRWRGKYKRRSHVDFHRITSRHTQTCVAKHAKQRFAVIVEQEAGQITSMISLWNLKCSVG